MNELIRLRHIDSNNTLKVSVSWWTLWMAISLKQSLDFTQTQCSTWIRQAVKSSPVLFSWLMNQLLKLKLCAFLPLDQNVNSCFQHWCHSWIQSRHHSILSNDNLLTKHSFNSCAASSTNIIKNQSHLQLSGQKLTTWVFAHHIIAFGLAQAIPLSFATNC